MVKAIFLYTCTRVLSEPTHLSLCLLEGWGPYIHRGYMLSLYIEFLYKGNSLYIQAKLYRWRSWAMDIVLPPFSEIPSFLQAPLHAF